MFVAYPILDIKRRRAAHPTRRVHGGVEVLYTLKEIQEITQSFLSLYKEIFEFSNSLP
jgi:hypothetical protein